MEFTIKTGSPAKSRTGILVLGAFADGVLPAPTAAVDAAAEGRISQLLKRGDLDDKAGSTLLLSGLDGSHAERVLLVSLGKQDEYGDKAYRDALAATAKMLAATAARDAVVTLADVALRFEVDGLAMPGRGLSTDVVEASARAFLNAINRVVRVAERGEDPRKVDRPGSLSGI